MNSRDQLITYVGRLSGGGLRRLERLIDESMPGLFGGMHLLPFFYPIDEADAGFDVIDHAIDPKLGTWDGAEYATAEGQRVQVVQRWTLSKVAAFANRVGGWVASRAGAIPEWSLSEVAVL